MPYIWLGIGLLAGATKGFCGKKTSGQISGWQDAMLVNILRMVICVVIGLVTVLAGGQVRALAASPRALAIYALSGITTSVFVVSWMIAVRSSAYVLISVFTMLGTIVPMLLGRFCYGEVIAWNQWVGFGLLMLATWILYSHSSKIKAKLSLKDLVVLLICGVANGLSGFSQKMFQNDVTGSSVSVFNLYTYLISGMCLLAVYLCVRPHQAEKAGKLPKIVVLYMPVMAVCLFLNSYAFTMAAGSIPASVLYPLTQGAGLVLSGLMSVLFFKEKLSAKAIIGLSIAFAGLMVTKFL